MSKYAKLENAIKIFKKNSTEEEMHNIFEIVLNIHREGLPLRYMEEIGLLVDSKDPNLDVLLMSVINMFFDYPGLYHFLSKEDGKNLINKLENKYGIEKLLNTSLCFSGKFQSVLIDIDEGYLTENKEQMLKGDDFCFNLINNKYREFHIDNLKKTGYFTNQFFEDLNRDAFSYVNINGVHKTLLYLENNGFDIIKNLIDKKENEKLHILYWSQLTMGRIYTKEEKNAANDYLDYVIGKLNQSNSMIKDVLDFSQTESSNISRYVIERYFDYSMEKEPETADMIIGYVKDSSSVYEKLLERKSQKEKEILSKDFEEDVQLIIKKRNRI